MLLSVSLSSIPPEPVLQDALDGRAEAAPDNVGGRLGDAVVAGERVLLAPLVQHLHQLGREPALDRKGEKRLERRFELMLPSILHIQDFCRLWHLWRGGGETGH